MSNPNASNQTVTLDDLYTALSAVSSEVSHEIANSFTVVHDSLTVDGQTRPPVQSLSWVQVRGKQNGPPWQASGREPSGHVAGAGPTTSAAAAPVQSEKTRPAAIRRTVFVMGPFLVRSKFFQCITW